MFRQRGTTPYTTGGHGQLRLDAVERAPSRCDSGGGEGRHLAPQPVVGQADGAYVEQREADLRRVADVARVLMYVVNVVEPACRRAAS
eukprot:2112007-Prymnesium_polylepis.2